MTGALEHLDASHLAFIRSIRDARVFVGQIESADQAVETKKRIDLAKEWAKIEKAGREVRVDLALLEIAFMRRVYVIGELNVFSKTMQGVARWWGEQHETQLRPMIEEFIDNTSSVKSIKEWAESGRDWRRNNGYVQSGDLYREQQTEVGSHTAADQVGVDWMTSGINKSLMAVVERWCLSKEDGFSITDLAQEVVEDLALEQQWDYWPGMHEGMLTLCREAVLRSPARLVGGERLPAFVTCVDRREGGTASGENNWIRVPLEFATLAQLRDHAALRRKQADDATRAADRAEDLLTSLLGAVDGDEEPYATGILDAASRLPMAAAS